MAVSAKEREVHEVSIEGMGTFEKSDLLSHLKTLSKSEQLNVVEEAMEKSDFPEAAKKILRGAIDRQRTKLKQLPAADKDTKVKFKAKLNSITLKKDERSYKVTLDEEEDDHESVRTKFALAFATQRNFNMTFLVPVEKEDGEVVTWKTVAFDTWIEKCTIESDGLSFTGTIPSDAVAQMSDLIMNWNDEAMEFFLDGFQQSMF